MAMHYCELLQLKRELMREVDAVKKMVPMDSSVQHATGRKLSSLTNELHGRCVYVLKQ